MHLTRRSLLFSYLLRLGSRYSISNDYRKLHVGDSIILCTIPTPLNWGLKTRSKASTAERGSRGM